MIVRYLTSKDFSEQFNAIIPYKGKVCAASDAVVWFSKKGWEGFFFDDLES